MCARSRQPDLTFVQHDVHRELLGEILGSVLDDAVVGLMVTGSVARGDAYPGSDLDLYALLRRGESRPFSSEVRRGIVVEISYADFELAERQIEERPMSVYRYLDGRSLYDPLGLLSRLVEIARKRFDTYEVSKEERERVAYWLESARVKMTAAREAGDVLRAAFVADTTSWPLLEGMWAAAGKPVPPNGSVLPHRGDLEGAFPQVGETLRRLFLGDATERIEASLELTDGTLTLLRRA